MRKIITSNKGLIKRNTSIEGKSIERMLSDKMAGEEIEMTGKALMYTERKDGVLPITNIRSDRFEIAMEANDNKERLIIAKTNEFKKKENEAKQIDMTKNPKGSQSTEG